MKVILFILLFFCFIICKAQIEDSIKFKAIGWTLAMPVDANELDLAIFKDIKKSIQNGVYNDTIDYTRLAQVSRPVTVRY